MTRKNVPLWLGLAAAAIFVDLALLTAPEIGASRLLFAPLGAAGLAGCYVLGVRKAAGASLRSRLWSGLLWASPWIFLLALPWGLLAAGYAWERAAPVVPPDAGRFGAGVLSTADGFKCGSASRTAWPEIERHYRERLARRGWRHEWTREFESMPAGAPAGAPLPRWSLFRRFDGLMLVSLGTLPNGQTAVISNYTHLRRRFDADHLLK